MPVEYHAQLPFLSGQLQILLPSDFSHNCLTRDPFPHSHPRFEAHYILCGQCTLVTDAQTLPCPSGHILILPPYLTHRIIPEASDTRTLSFLYTPDTESRFPPGCTLFPAAPQLIEDQFSGKQRLLQIQEELLARKPAYSEKIKGELTALLADLTRSMGAAGHTASIPADETRAEAIEAYLVKHRFDPNCSCDALARQLHLSPRQVQRLCMQYFHASFRTLLTTMRMEIAAHRLRTTKTPIHALAEDLGYASAVSFSAAYKRHFGYPPSRDRT